MKKKMYKFIWMIALILSIFVMKTDIVHAENENVEEKINTYGDFKYSKLDGTEYIEIVGYTGRGGVILYPGEIEGKKVYSITCSFNNQNLPREEDLLVKEVVIPEGVKEISDLDAFKNLEKVQLPESLEVIGGYTFQGCTKLEAVKIPLGLKKIEREAFYDCKSIKEIHIPKGVSVIKELTFAGCSGLKNVTISSGVKIIEQEAFANCTSLREIIIPDSVVKMEEAVFWECVKLAKVKLSKNLSTIPKDCFYNCNIKSIEIPKKVKKIAEAAFMNNSFTSITIPSKVTYIGNRAFSNCKKLRKVTIKGTKVKQIKKYAFANINKKATFDVPNKCKKKYKAMLIKAGCFKEGKMKIK